MNIIVTRDDDRRISLPIERLLDETGLYEWGIYLALSNFSEGITASMLAVFDPTIMSRQKNAKHLANLIPAMWAGCTVKEAWGLRDTLQARGLIYTAERGEDPLYEVLVPCDCPDGEGWLK